MGWKATGQPTVRKQRDKWAVRVDGIDTETGKHRPRQLGSYPSQRTALKAARSVSVQARVATRDTVGWLVRRYVGSRSDVTLKAREQYEWAIPHIEAGLGAIRLDRLDREDVARWLDDLASAGHLSWRSIQICRTVLRAALADAVEEGLLRRSPAARVPMPRAVAKPPKQKEVDAWTDEQVARFLSVSADHRWAVAFRLGVLYGLRRSEALALKWDDLDAKKSTLRIDEGLVAVRRGAAWSNAKNDRSRRVIHSRQGDDNAHAARGARRYVRHQRPSSHFWAPAAARWHSRCRLSVGRQALTGGSRDLVSLAYRVVLAEAAAPRLVVALATAGLGMAITPLTPATRTARASRCPGPAIGWPWPGASRLRSPSSPPPVPWSTGPPRRGPCASNRCDGEGARLAGVDGRGGAATKRSVAPVSSHVSTRARTVRQGRSALVHVRCHGRTRG
jgi:integrase